MVDQKKEGGVVSFWSRNWWMVLFCLFTLVSAFHFLKEKQAALSQLALRQKTMEAEKKACFELQDELTLRIASQSDPAWIEMILMRDLGVVPEGFLKVHFQK